MYVRRLLSFVAFVCLTLAVTSCGGGGGGGDDETTVGDDTPRSGEGTDLTSDCGVGQNNAVVNPVNSADGEQVTVTSVIDSTHVVVQRAAGPQLIQLHGVSAPENGETLARNTLSALATEPAVLFEVGESCTVTGPGGSAGIAGYLFTLSGKSYVEEVIKAGVALTINPNDVCSATLLSACYAALEENFRPRTMGEITDFLWKPRAESAYNEGSLVIHANPCNATVVVSGQPLLDFGPGNGRCNTSRAFQPGCAFGNNVKVEIFDNDSGLPYTHDGEPFVIVPRGCDRFSFVR